ncbi:uncharacterized protein LOC133194211 [Saccostrea echinata]|uniref:uncharacterized protein LOC133194211 n=1 Tax=Saccostrea echinata TaxID=191078 RepID=UPI002A7F1644|nr:uncharacterized protein LOC133194211 [Saccostrea echinata]
MICVYRVKRGMLQSQHSNIIKWCSIKPHRSERSFTKQCKVRQCSQCLEDTEFYCNTCKHDLCIQCKERHVTDSPTKYHKVVFYKAHRNEKSLTKQYTIYHDVVIYREKYKYTTKEESCVRHPDRNYEMFCLSCELPVCFQCKEHIKHPLLDSKIAYETSRQQHREVIHNIRSEALYNSCFLLVGIKTDVKACPKEVSNHQSEMSTKATRLKRLIDTVICDVKTRHTTYIKDMHRFELQKSKMNRHFAIIEKFENRFEQSANRSVKFLLFLKKTRFPERRPTPSMTKPALLSLSQEINIQDVIKLLNEIQIKEKGRRHVRYEPMLHKSFTVTEVHDVRHISCVMTNRSWISNWMNILVLTNTEGETLQHLTVIDSYYRGAHTVNNSCDLIYIHKDKSIKKLSKDNTRVTLRKKQKTWIPQCVYCSPSSGDLLVGMQNTMTAMVKRYNERGQHIQTISQNETGQKLYSSPNYITENRNGDVIVSDAIAIFSGAVVVTEHGGRHRFSYTGPPSGSELDPQGICTDALSHILICDRNTHTVQMIDKNGHFLSLILTQHEISGPQALYYDRNTHLLWVGSWRHNIVGVYRYINKQNYLTEAEMDPSGY